MSMVKVLRADRMVGVSFDLVYPKLREFTLIRRVGRV
jgi:hypothetical protein